MTEPSENIRVPNPRKPLIVKVELLGYENAPEDHSELPPFVLDSYSIEVSQLLLNEYFGGPLWWRRKTLMIAVNAAASVIIDRAEAVGAVRRRQGPL